LEKSAKGEPLPKEEMLMDYQRRTGKTPGSYIKADSGLQAYGAWSVNIGTLGQIRIGACN
jgi:hypothetical protein